MTVKIDAHECVPKDHAINTVEAVLSELKQASEDSSFLVIVTVREYPFSISRVETVN